MCAIQSLTLILLRCSMNCTQPGGGGGGTYGSYRKKYRSSFDMILDKLSISYLEYPDRKVGAWAYATSSAYCGLCPHQSFHSEGFYYFFIDFALWHP